MFLTRLLYIGMCLKANTMVFTYKNGMCVSKKKNPKGKVTANVFFR